MYRSGFSQELALSKGACLAFETICDTSCLFAPSSALDSGVDVDVDDGIKSDVDRPEDD